MTRMRLIDADPFLVLSASSAFYLCVPCRRRHLPMPYTRVKT